jgi:hypothetical protein
MIKSNELKIITRDAGASGLHSNAAHWNEELLVLFNKNLPYCHFVKFYCLKPDNKTYFVSQFLKSMALTQRIGTKNSLFYLKLFLIMTLSQKIERLVNIASIQLF